MSRIKLSTEEKISKIENHFAEIMNILGLNLKDASLKNTPNRVAKMYVNETFRALSEEPPKITVFPNEKYDQMVVMKDITLHSMCEHHFVPFVGTCHIAYMPKNKVIGLSKLVRVAQYFAAQPQIQEKLTNQIADHLKKVLDTDDIAVVINAKHFCCATRGARDITSSTITSHMGGLFREGLRSEFLNFVK